MESLVLKGQIVHAAAEYQSEFEDLLKVAKREKNTTFVRSSPWPDNNLVNVFI